MKKQFFAIRLRSEQADECPRYTSDMYQLLQFALGDHATNIFNINLTIWQHLL